MIQVAAENLAVAAAGIVLLFYLGAGLSRWLPSALAPYRWLVAPWAGYCLLVVVTQFLTNSPFSLTALQSAYVAAALATGANLLAAWRRGKAPSPVNPSSQVERENETSGDAPNSLPGSPLHPLLAQEGEEVGSAPNAPAEGTLPPSVAFGEKREPLGHTPNPSTERIQPPTVVAALRPPTSDPRPRILAALTLAVFVLSVLPLWSYGYTTVIGENWDAEIYLGLGEYLKVYPQAELARAVSNPVLDTLVNPPYGLRTHGFSYFQAALGFLPFDSLRTLAPLLALLRALAVPAAYVFFCAGLRFGPRPALLASAVLGLNAFLLWITYNTFGMQVPTFGLLPLLLCFTLVTLDQAAKKRSSWAGLVQSAAWAGLFFAAVAVTYHPALTAYAAMAGPVVLAMLVLHRRTALWRILGSIGLIALVGLLLSLVSQLKSIDGFLKQYGEKTAGLGLTGFTSPADAFGFSLSFRDLLPTDPGRPLFSLASHLYSLAGWAALLGCITLIASYFYRLWTRQLLPSSQAWQQTALLAGAIAYPLLFLRPLDYPYGWFKALSFVSFVLVGFAAAGLLELRFPALIQNSKLKIQNSAGLALFALMLLTIILTMRMYWGTPLRYDRPMLEVGAVRDVIRATGGEQSVYISNSPNMQRLGRLYNGLLSYFLRDTDLYGNFKTANSGLDRERPDGLYRYLLLNAADNPTEYGAAPGASPTWRNSLMALYAFPPPTGRPDLYHHNYRNDGKYPSVPATLSVAGNRIDIQPGDQPQPAPARPHEPLEVTLGLASFTTQTLQLRTTGEPASSARLITVPPGYSSLKSTALASGGSLSLPFAGGVPLDGSGMPQNRTYITWAHLAKSEGSHDPEQGPVPGGPGLLAGVTSNKQGDTMAVSIDYLNNRPDVPSQTLSLDIYGEGRGSPVHYGYWNFAVPPATPLTLSLTLDPATKTLTPAPGTSATQTTSFTGPTGDGSYTASLLVYENGQLSESFNDIFKFELKSGKLASFTPRTLPPQFR
ncbi:MAG: hypothetical protein ACJ78Q_16530 [Chloroflexia bacterium]